MKTIFYTLFISIFFMSVSISAQSFSNEQKAFLKEKIVAIQKISKSIDKEFSSSRTDISFLPDSTIEYILDTDTGEFIEDGRFIFIYEGEGEDKRVDFINYFTDFSGLGLPLPVEMAIIDLTYDNEGRVVRTTFALDVGLLQLEILESTVTYDNLNRIVKTFLGGLIFEEEEFRDSIVYTDNSNNLPASIQAFLFITDESDPSNSSYQLIYERKDISYNQDNVLTDYTEVLYNEEESVTEIYEDVQWYDYQPEFALFEPLFASFASIPTAEDLTPVKPASELASQQTFNKKTRIDEELPFDLVTFRSTVISGDTVTLITDEPQVVKELEIYILSSDGNVKTRTSAFDFDLDQILPISRNNYDYDNRGNLTLSTSEFFDTGNWILGFRDEYSYDYDEYDRTIEIVETSYDGEGVAEFGSRYEIFYPEVIDTDTRLIEILQAKVSISPNPAIDITNINIIDLENTGIIHFRLFNTQGKVVWTHVVKDITPEMNVALPVYNLLPGIYKLLVLQGNASSTLTLMRK
jgi:hypothetical protein